MNIDAKKAKYLPTSQHHKFKESVEIKKLIPNAIIPARATDGSIGYDVHTTASITIEPGKTALLPTGLATALPQNMYLRIAPRSSLALKGLSVEAGVIDSDYRGEIKVILRNHGPEPYQFHMNDKVAQFIFERASTPQIELVDKLSQTVRGKGGFGSTDQVQSTTTKSYRVSPTQVLYLAKGGGHPIVCRMQIPKVIIDPEEELESTQPIPDVGEPEKCKEIHPTQEFLITHHEIDDMPNTPVNEIFKMDIEEIPTDHESEPQLDSSSSHEEEPLITESPVTKVNSSQRRHVTISREMLAQSIGFRQPEPLLQHLKTIGNGSVNVQRIPKNPQLDPGETATMKSNRRNTEPLKIPKHFGEIMHMDIGYGPCRAIGGIQYTLLVVDRATRHKFVYGLKNLKKSLHEAIQQLMIDCCGKIKMLRTDFDKKLIAGDTRKLLKNNKIQVQASPPYRQHQNGLVERHWQTIVDMARNWLKSALLPTKYWYYAVKRACEITNILPIKFEDKITTPYERVFNKKVDYRVLFPMFSTAYIRYMHADNEAYQTDEVNKKWAADSLKCIVVGTCTTSDGLLFYHPPTKRTFSCGDGYKFDTFAPSGIQFGERYDGNFTFVLKSEEVCHIAPTHEKNATVYFYNKENNTYVASKVLTQPVDEEEEFYTIQEIESSAIHQVKAEDILDHNPLAPVNNEDSSLLIPELPWVKQFAKATLYLSDRMARSKQGRITRKEGKWYFCPGRSPKSEDTHQLIADDLEQLRSLIINRKLFYGWKTHTFCAAARRIRATSNLVAELIISRKVSAKGLMKMEAPASLLKHQQLHPNDKKIWDESYRQEYQGLIDIDTWETISEEEYQNMKHIYKGLMPTMAISVIKYDGYGNPVRAKYRIVALGNLDPNSWEKSDCFAPVLSQPELRLLTTALAAKKKRIPKQGDITQAFCQSYLPEGENYICKPPIGCPLTPKGRYWKLKKTLYGLKRSPRHFYDLCKKTLLSIGMKQHPTSPCLFVGTLIPGQPPLYLGVYVDDMIFFSESDEVEQKFQKDFGEKLDTTFDDKINYFLGIQFTYKWHDDGNLTIKLSQPAYIENIIASAGLQGDAVNSVPTPYKSGLPVDSIPNITLPVHKQEELTHQMRVICGSLNWLSQSTRPDIATITNMLSKYTSKPNKFHIDHAKRVTRYYLKGTKNHGISFSSSECENLESFIKFPIPDDGITALCDANWGPQDQSKPKPNETRTLDLFKSRSISGYLLWYGGPLHWVSKRQAITARSSAEAEIYATDECTKALLHFHYLLDGLNLTKELMSKPTTVYNDNNACVQWSRNTTTKGLRHIQIRENAVRESVQRNFIQVKHIEGKTNLSDMFTKEDKDPAHFIKIRDFVLTDKINRVSIREQPPFTIKPVESLHLSSIMDEDFTLRGVSGWE